MQNLSHLRNYVQSAASVVSSASRTLGIDRADKFSVTYGSSFGDTFTAEPGETMLRWISSNTVYKFGGDQAANPDSRRLETTRGNSMHNLDRSGDSDRSDSDSDLEAEIIQALLKRGKDKLRTEDFCRAERLFRNRLSRTSSNVTLKSPHRTQKKTRL
jgi:hypothetical protein